MLGIDSLADRSGGCLLVDQPQDARAVHEKATRNVTWDSSLYVGLLHVLELTVAPASETGLMALEDVVSTSLARSLASAEQYHHLFMNYLGAVRRWVQGHMEKSYPAQAIQKWRDISASCAVFMRQYFSARR